MDGLPAPPHGFFLHPLLYNPLGAIPFAPGTPFPGLALPGLVPGLPITALGNPLLAPGALAAVSGEPIVMMKEEQLRLQGDVSPSSKAAEHLGKQSSPDGETTTSTVKESSPIGPTGHDAVTQLTTKGLQGQSSAASLMSLAATGQQPQNLGGSLHSSVTALPLLERPAPLASPHLDQSPAGASDPVAMQMGSSTNLLALADASAGRPTRGVTLNIAPLDTGFGEPPARQARSSARMRKNSSCTSLPEMGTGLGPGMTGGARRAGVAGSTTNLQHLAQFGAFLVQPPALSLPHSHSKHSLRSQPTVGEPSSPNAIRPIAEEEEDWAGSHGRGMGGSRQASHGRQATGTPEQGDNDMAVEPPVAPRSSRGIRSGNSLGPRASGAGVGAMSRISSLQALVEVAAAAAEDTHTQGGGPAPSAAGAATSSMRMTSGDPDADDDMMEANMGNMDESELKRLKRKQSNRESARRSRLKKQAESDALTRATQELQTENARLRSALTASQGLVGKLVQEKAELMDQVRKLGGEVAPTMEWQPPVMVVPPSLLNPHM